MAQNIYDDPEFFEGYSRLGRSREGLAGAAEWPVLQSMLPNLNGRRVVDLGCGYGWFCRWARANGAAEVVGIDVSERMLAQAKARTGDAAIRYQRADLERLALPESAFDLAYSSLALHYVADVARLIATVHRALMPGGWFVFSTEHPIYMAATRPDWIADGEGCRVWPVGRYQAEGPRVTDWLTKRVLKHHRTIATTLNALIRVGFAISRVEEFGPTDEQVAAKPELAEERERPMFLLVSARR